MAVFNSCTQVVSYSFCLCLLLTASAQPTTNTPAADSGPRIQFAEPIHDFGRVEYGRVLTNFFAFTNAGNQVLELRDVVSSCGCVAAQNWDRRVEPGKAGMLPVIFTASGIGDKVMKPIRITCNDPTQSNAVVYVQAIIYKPIDAVPPVAVFSFGPDFQTNLTRELRLVSNVQEPLTLEPPVCTNRSFRTELKTLKEGKEFALEVTVIPPLGPGTLVAPITVKTSSTNMPVVTVTAYAMVQPALAVSPPRVMLPPAPLAETNQVTVTIQSKSTNTLVLSEPSLNTEGAKVLLREVEPGRLFQLLMSFPAGFRIPPGQKLEARVKCNYQQAPVVAVPVFQSEEVADSTAPGTSPPLSTNSTNPSAQAVPLGPAPVALQK